MRVPFNGNYPTTQRFNDSCCRASYTRFGMQGHNGIDYGVPIGTEVVAAHQGKVFVGYEAGGYGNYIFLTAPDGSQTVYGHLDRAVVSTGQVVQEGQAIARSGNTGNSSGPHLHFGFRPAGYNRNNGFLGYENPSFTGGSTPQGGDDMVIQGENEFARANQLHQQLLGRPLGRDVFNKLVGKSWLNVIEIFSDHTDTIARQTEFNALKAQVSTQATQIADLTKQVKELQAKLSVQSDDTQLLNGFGEFLTKMIARLGLKK